jgi:hypothetical protein
MHAKKVLSDSKENKKLAILESWSILIEKNVLRIRNKTFYLQFCMETPEGHQKSIFNSSKEKKNKDTYGFYPIKFANSTQKHKKIIKTPNQPIEKKKISNKSMFNTSKVRRRQKFKRGLHDGVCRLDLKSCIFDLNINGVLAVVFSISDYQFISFNFSLLIYSHVVTFCSS